MSRMWLYVVVVRSRVETVLRRWNCAVSRTWLYVVVVRSRVEAVVETLELCCI